MRRRPIGGSFGVVPNPGHPLNEGRLAWWLIRPYNNQGGALVDLMQQSHALPYNTVSGTPSPPVWGGTSRPGGLGQLNFNGSSNYLAVPDSPVLRPSAQLTLAVWANLTTTAADMCLISKNSSAAPWGSPYLSYFLRYENTPDMDFGLQLGGSTTFFQPTYVMPTNTWTRVVATYDGATMTVYINGAKLASQAASGTITYSTQPLTIGADNSSSPVGDFWPGALDDISVCNGAWSPALVEIDYYESQLGYPNALMRGGAALWGRVTATTSPLVWPYLIKRPRDADSLAILDA